MANRLLSIGIDHYLFQNKLNNCVKDLRDFKELLLEKYDFDDAHVVELFDANATNTAIQDTIKSLAKEVDYNDNLIIYFSGHGHFDETSERGFWVPVEGTHSYTTWIPNETVIAHINSIHCRHIFLISDSCFSNSLLNTSPTKGLNDYEKYKSRWALTSSFRQAYDSRKGENGPFANAIVEFLRNSEKDFRVTELIEAVKANFSGNDLQTPQGGVLFCKGHSGGEMIFRIKQGIDKRNLKGYNDFQKALKLYKRTSDFRKVQVYEDRTKKIGFQLYQELDVVIKKSTFYLYLYEGINQHQTFQFLNENHPNIFKDKNLIIFLTKERNQHDPNIRIGNINSKFKPINSFYIDDFIREQCTPTLEFDKSKFLSISNFVLPIGNGLDKKNLKEFIENWFNEPNRPVLAINGSGGIGKTTFAQYIADLWTQKSPKTHVIFIDSVQIKDRLIRNSEFEEFGLYDFYEAFFEVTDSSTSRLTEETFKINIDAGNILVVIDGLDEVISKVRGFSVDKFLNSINEASKELANGKVVVACRTHFWDISTAGSADLSVVELKPFNFEQAKQFFEKSLDSNTKVKKALRLADQFKIQTLEKEDHYHPYVLDVVRSIIGSNGEVVDIDLSEFSSKLLKGAIKSDYVVYRVCDRERKRVGQISVDDQAKFFIHLAVEKRGSIKAEMFKQTFEESVGRKIDNVTANAMKSHPFIFSGPNSIHFKYDFLSDLFKGIYLSNFFDVDSGRSEITPQLVALIEENCWFNSAMNADIANRMLHWTEYDMLQVADLIQQIDRSGSFPDEKKRLFIGNLFALCLHINSKFVGDDIESNTKVLKALFERKPGEIENLVIINIGVEHNIRFDFSQLSFSRCYVREYHSFWDCKFGDTKFSDSHLLNLKLRSDRQSQKEISFLDCTFDQETEAALRQFESNFENSIAVAKDFLNDFFHLFFSSGRLGRQWEHKIIEPRFSGISKNRFDYNQTIKILKAHGALEISREKGQTKMAVSEAFQEDVVRFIKDGTLSVKISNLIKELSDG